MFSVWKLTQVLRGWADISLLRTVSVSTRTSCALGADEPLQYEAERRKYAQDLINFDKLYSKLVSNRPAEGKAREASNYDQVFRYNFFNTSIALS